MIDTGSSRSFISPNKANEFFQPFKYSVPFEVISTHGRSYHDEAIHIPLLETFRCKDAHTFYIYEVDRDYDGLIGSDLLSQLGANIDMKNQVLRTRDTEIPFVYNPQINIRLEPRSETRLTLPTDIHDGTGIIEYQEFKPGVRMPCALVHCVNGQAYTVVQNTLETPVTLKINRLVNVTQYEPQTIETNMISDNDLDIDDYLIENLERLRLDHMNTEENKMISALCYEYRDIFYCDKLPLTFTNKVKHSIRTKNEDPVYLKPYRQPQAVNDEINRQVDKLLKDNVIQESFSPWNFPVHLVPKKMDASGEKKYRMVIDYRRLNDMTTDDKYPLPNISDLFDRLGKSTYFTTLDLASGYHQIEIEKSDRQKTAFSSQAGHFEFKRMPFGLKTAPATFQRAMDSILRGLQGIHCLVYLDDIIIFSSSLQEHVEKLRKIFERLRQTNLKIQLDKSEFLRKEVLYLGHSITKDGLKPNNDKIEAVLNFPLPKSQTEIKSFLGLVGYYRKFIKDFAKLTRPMTVCLKKNHKVVLDKEFIEAFERCKELLTNAPLLQFPDFDKQFILTTDASDYAIGAVLSQGTVGSDRPVAYASRTLNDPESRYSTIEKEALAIIWAIKHFRPYLYGKKFTIYTDHRPLSWLHSFEEPSSKITRWRLRLAEYDYEVIYKNGRQNTNADALSRVKVNAIGNNENDNSSMQVNIDEKEQELQRHCENITKELVELQNKKEKTKSTPQSRHLISSDSDKTVTLSLHSESTLSVSEPDANQRSSPYPIPVSSSDTITASDSESNIGSETVHSTRNMNSEGIPILNEAVDTKPNQILVYTWFRDETAIKDISNKKQRILEVHMPLNKPELIKDFLKRYIRTKIKYFIYFEDQQHRAGFTEAVITLFKKGTVNILECTDRVVYVENEEEQKSIINKYHVGKNCHRGIKETVKHIKRTYFWHNLDVTVAAVINSCESCKKLKYDRKPFKPTLQLTQTQNRPFEELFIDVFKIEGKSYLTIIDAFSKLGQALEISNHSAPEVVRALIKYFSYYGTPKRISSDSGSEFNNSLIRELLDFYKIELHVGTPNNTNSMGLIERFHSTLLEIYRLAKYERKLTDASTVMTFAIMAYNHSIHSVTGLTPFEVVLGHTEAKNAFDINLDKEYMQILMRDHKRRTKFLYKSLTDKMLQIKENTKNKRGGETSFNINPDDTIFFKGTNVRRGKDKPRYEKGVAVGEAVRNIIRVTTKNRDVQVPIKDIKRPPQERLGAVPVGSDPTPGPSTSAT